MVYLYYHTTHVFILCVPWEFFCLNNNKLPNDENIFCCLFVFGVLFIYLFIVFRKLSKPRKESYMAKSHWSNQTMWYNELWGNIFSIFIVFKHFYMIWQFNSMCNVILTRAHTKLFMTLFQQGSPSSAIPHSKSQTYYYYFLNVKICIKCF